MQYLDYYEYAECHCTVHFICFRLEIPLLGKFGPKSQDFQFKVKFSTYVNLNMQNSMVRSVLSVLEWK